ncbi:thyrotropin-releasing hormone-degrading ectoenzyme [Rhipicephalus microplus]|uniref:thyrotropin-releasing hormone-degrading ectoenzyme n=1 Tax=Rhipicephalus microplus TaxID=6941 RepID=UPI003F6D50CA
MKAQTLNAHSRASQLEFVAQHYDIRLETDLTSTFSGDLSLHITCHHATHLVTLFSRNLTLSEVSVRPRVGHARESETAELVGSQSPFTTFKLKWNLQPSADYLLSTRFSGSLHHGDHRKWPPGMYREAGDSYTTVTSYVDQLHDAAFFPTVQSVMLKSTFSLSVLKPNASVAVLSSWDLLKDTQALDGQTYAVFQKTPPISVNQVAVAVTTLPKATDGFTTLHAHMVNMPRLQHLLEFCTNVVEMAAEATGISFPNKGLDVLALHRFPRACRSTWKLVVVRAGTFKTNAAGGLHTNLGRPYLRLTIELLSTWFGNMVTVGPWLDRGLAVLYAIKVLKLAKPQWLLDDILHLYRFITLSSVDLGPTHEKVLYDYELPIAAVSLLAMFRFAVGQDSFKVATTDFLKKTGRDDVAEQEFWDSLKASSSMEDIANYTSVWRQHSGYPLLKVVREDAETIHVMQEPFFCSSCHDSRSRMQAPQQSMPATIWPIPITLSYASEPQKIDVTAVVWMVTPEVTLKAPNAHFDDWVLLNVGNEGLYRVDYDDSNWSHLIRQLQNDSSVIPVANRAQIIDNLFHLALAGYRDRLYASALHFRTFEMFFASLAYLEKERDTLPWTHFVRLARALPHDAVANRSEWSALNRRICKGIVSDLGTAAKEPAMPLARSDFKYDVLQYCCQFGHEKCPALFFMRRHNPYQKTDDGVFLGTYR